MTYEDRLSIEFIILFTKYLFVQYIWIELNYLKIELLFQTSIIPLKIYGMLPNFTLCSISYYVLLLVDLNLTSINDIPHVYISSKNTIIIFRYNPMSQTKLKGNIHSGMFMLSRPFLWPRYKWTSHKISLSHLLFSPIHLIQMHSVVRRDETSSPNRLWRLKSFRQYWQPVLSLFLGIPRESHNSVQTEIQSPGMLAIVSRGLPSSYVNNALSAFLNFPSLSSDVNEKSSDIHVTQVGRVRGAYVTAVADVKADDKNNETQSENNIVSERIKMGR